MKALLSPETEKILLKELGIKTLSEIDEMDFPDKDREFDREDIEAMSHRSRGSVRITEGRYFTEKEYTEYRKHVRALKL